MERARRWLLIAALGAALAGLSAGSTTAAPLPAIAPADLGLVPKPRAVTLTGGTFAVPNRLTIAAGGAAERNVAHVLIRFLALRGIAATIGDPRSGVVRIALVHDLVNAGPEAYRLQVDERGISIAAGSGAGLFYGVQTLEQLFASNPHDTALATASIVDWPAYRWRGIHLDVARHFFPVATVERYIDVAAHFKLNTFHWHLTDDQGWRIAIARYPRLTQIGACRSGSEVANDPGDVDEKRYCGHYTHAQIRAVVAYAAARYVTIVPEIEMPGHNVAALAAYPWLACAPGRYRVRTTWGVSTDVACPTERTFRFEQNVLREVIGLFPGVYVHIGGDEVPKDAWMHSAFVAALMRHAHLRNYDAVQGYFTRRIEQFLTARGRKLIGWDEILDGGVSRQATVMSWRGTDGGIRAARRGNDVVMSPDGPLYLDWAQGDPNLEPVAADGVSTPQMIYDFNPTPTTLTAAQATHILGVQGNMWTEHVSTEAHLFYLLLPRALAVAEDGWTPAADRVWSDFTARMVKQYAWFAANGLQFHIPAPTMHVDGGGAITLENVHRSYNESELRVTGTQGTIRLNDDVPDATLFYTTDDSEPTTASARYSQPLSFDLRTIGVIHVRAIAVLSGGRSSVPTTLTLRR